MSKSLDKALENVNITYNELKQIADNIAQPCLREINELVANVKNNIENLSNEEIRILMDKLSVNSFSVSEIKEKSALKAECATTLRKDRYAEEFSLAEGAVANKDSIATRNISEEILVEAIYELISSLFKVKLDETHRLVDTLKTVLMTRLSEAKLVQIDTQM